MGDAEQYDQACRIFDEVVELSPEEREAALLRYEVDEPETVELARRLISQDGRTVAFGFDSPVDESDPAGVLGTTVGSYTIESLVGSGGMGAVYLGRRQNPEARVAIKFISLTAASASAVERFADETQLLAAVEHAGVVRYRDSGLDSRGRPYLVMEYVDGEPLTHAVPEIAASVPRTVELLVNLAEAVHHLHQRRILHRDLKPSNILLRREGGNLRPVLIDFGIARALEERGEIRTTGTLGLGPVGTPAFMSPEQSHRKEAPDVRTDVHGIGAVAFALLTGHPPRELDRVAGGDLIDLHTRLRTTEARSPSASVDPACFGEEGARRRARGIDRDLEAVLLKAVALDPDDRYGSAEALAADLQRWCDRLPVLARRVGPMGRLVRMLRRRPVESFLGAAAIALLIGGGIATAVSRAREVRARERYQEQLAITEAVNRFYTLEVFARAMPEADGPETPVIEVLRTAAKGVAPLDAEPAVATAVRSALFGIFSRLGAEGDADEQFEQASPLVAALAPNHPQRLTFELEHARVLARRSQYPEAEAVLRRLLAVAEAEPGSHAKIEALAANTLAVVLLSRNDLDEVGPLLERALEGIQPGDSEYTHLLNNQALWTWLRGDRDAAVSLFEELQERLEARLGPEHVSVMGVHTNLASLHLDRRRPLEALPHAEKALALSSKIFEADHPDRLMPCSLLASCFSHMGRFDESIELYLEVAAGRMERLGPDNASVGEALANLASVLVRAGRVEEAIDPGREALETLRRTLGDYNTATASALLTVASIEDLLGNTDEALARTDEAISIYETMDGDYPVAITEARAFREGVVLRAQGRER